ncbi:MAG TPA: hypothetical protein VLI06_07715 [Solimonas sp.]|nr:hypothetical protein [Solimonas sp.]
MSDFSKSERRVLRDLAGHVYEAEAGRLLGELEASFKEWRAGEKLSSDLLQDIHQFHQHGSRELWSMYQSLKEQEIVARGIALGLIPEAKLEPALLEKLRTRIEDFKNEG